MPNNTRKCVGTRRAKLTRSAARRFLIAIPMYLSVVRPNAEYHTEESTHVTAFKTASGFLSGC